MTADAPPIVPRRSWRRLHWRRLAAHALLVVVVATTLGPLVWMAGISLESPVAVFRNVLNPLPEAPTLANYGTVLATTDVGRQVLNSVVFAAGVTLGQIAIAVPAAYAFARWRFPGADALFAAMLLTLPIPFVVFYVPNYILLSRFDLLNTFVGLIVPQIASAYGIFLLRQHFRAFPAEIVEAARIDGAGEDRSSGRSSCRRPAAPSQRWPSTSESRPGTSTSGRCSSPPGPTCTS
jgi:ABC-type glycerol-3-phosphate transport system permease component